MMHQQETDHMDSSSGHTTRGGYRVGRDHI